MSIAHCHRWASQFSGVSSQTPVERRALVGRLAASAVAIPTIARQAANVILVNIVKRVLSVFTQTTKSKRGRALVDHYDAMPRLPVSAPRARRRRWRSNGGEEERVEVSGWRKQSFLWKNWKVKDWKVNVFFPVQERLFSGKGRAQVHQISSIKWR